MGGDGVVWGAREPLVPLAPFLLLAPPSADPLSIVHRLLRLVDRFAVSSRSVWPETDGAGTGISLDNVLH